MTHTWKRLRIFLLAIILGTLVAILLKLIFSPNILEEKIVNSFVFPESVPLTNWELVKSTPINSIKESDKESDKKIDAHKYQYRQNNLDLDVEAYYLPYTDSNISRLLNIHKQIGPAVVTPTIKYRPEVGFYGVFIHQQQAHLTACLNFQGQSTVTEQQHTKNKYFNGVSLRRTLFWFLGQEDFADGRCLWTLMSIPIRTESKTIPLVTANQTLETAWVDWYDSLKPKLSSSS